MRITFVTASLEAGGAERILSWLANRFAADGATVNMLVMSPEKPPFYNIHPSIQLHYLKNKPEKAANPIVRQLKLIPKILKLRKAIKQTQPDYIVSFIDVTNLATLAAGLGLKKPIIVSERSSPADHKIGKLYESLRQKLYPFARKVVVQTPATAAYFSHLKNITTIPNPIPEPEYKKSSVNEIQKLISVGRLDRNKDFATAIEALALLKKDFSNISLTILGDGPEKDHLIALTRKQGLDDNVSIAGNSTEVIKQLSEHDCFVFPTRYEGFPNALAEAMSVGLPVVASNIVGNHALVEDGENGLMFGVGDAADLASKVTSLCRNNTLANTLAHNAKHTTKNFGEDQIFAMWKKLFI